MVALPIIISFWHGPLSWLERLCISSFVRHGHAFHLYTYDAVAGLPEGAVRVDAAKIMPQSEMFFYKNSHTPAVFADLFRLKLMEQQKGLWADCDVYCLRPFNGLGDYVFGYERAPGQNQGSINNAIFGCPAESDLLRDLLSIFDPENADKATKMLPPLRRFEVKIRALFGQKANIANMQFGATGPFALTHFVVQHQLQAHAKPVEAFYPIAYEKIPELMQPGSDIADYTTAASYAVHLWRSQLTRRGRADLPTPKNGSALEKLCQQDGIAL